MQPSSLSIWKLYNERDVCPQTPLSYFQKFDFCKDNFRLRRSYPYSILSSICRVIRFPIAQPLLFLGVVVLLMTMLFLLLLVFLQVAEVVFLVLLKLFFRQVVPKALLQVYSDIVCIFLMSRICLISLSKGFVHNLYKVKIIVVPNL